MVNIFNTKYSMALLVVMMVTNIKYFTPNEGSSTALDSAFNLVNDKLKSFGVRMYFAKADESVLVVDHKASFDKARKQINLYRAYKECVNKSHLLPMPEMRMANVQMTEIETIKSYERHVVRLVDYITNIKSLCTPPPLIKLPVHSGDQL